MEHSTLKKARHLFLTILQLLYFFHLSSQENFTVYTVPSTAGAGLSDIRVVDLSGFGTKLWLATDQGGVNTFDGANWEKISEQEYEIVVLVRKGQDE